MNRVRCGIGIFLLAGSFLGCGGGVTPENLPPEQKATDYGKKTSQKMVDMYGVPGKGGKMVKPQPDQK